MNELKIEIGDAVKIAESSKYSHSRYESNPRCEGVCTAVQGSRSLTYHVEWANGHGNYYRLCDLTLIKKGKKEMKEFTKSDLIKLAQTETVFVKQRNGRRKIVLGDNLCGDKRRWTSLSNFGEGLTNHGEKEFDITEVYTTSEGSSLPSYLAGHFLTPIWERTEQTEAQKEMASLQVKMSEMQDQVNALQGVIDNE